MNYRTIGSDPASARRVSVIALGAMNMGTSTDEATSFAILDRYLEAGGNLLDTANNYAYWHNRTRGGESEALLGRWRHTRGIGDEVVIATKVGGRPTVAGLDFQTAARPEYTEGLGAQIIAREAQESRQRLGVERIALYYSHVQDPRVATSETVEALAGLVADGTVGLLGASNHWSWRLERARAAATAAGLPGYEVLQYHYSYLRPRMDLDGRRSRGGDVGVLGGELMDYLRSEPGLTLLAYSPLLSGAYVRDDRPLPAIFNHPGTPARLAALRDVARELQATPNQVVLAWMLGGDLPVIPLLGVSSISQLDECLAAVDLELSAEQRARMDAAG